MAAVNVRVRPAGAGLAWLSGALRLIGRQPLPLLVLILLGPMACMVLLFLPWIGQALCVLLLPGIVLGMLTVCRAVELGALPGLSCYSAGLRTPALRLRLLQIGIATALASGIINLAWNLLPEAPEPAAPAQASAPKDSAPGTPAAGPSAPGAALPQPAPPVRSDATDEASLPRPSQAQMAVFLLTVVLSFPVGIIMLIATALVGWHDMTSPKAIFFAFFAAWRNRAPIVVNAFASLGLGFLVLMAAMALGTLLGLGDAGLERLLMPVMLLLMAVQMASNYRMVCDILDEQPAP